MSERTPGRLADRPLVWAAAAFAAGVLLHLDRLPWWCSLLVLAIAGWRLAGERGAIALPRRRVSAVLAIVLVLLVAAGFRTLNGLAAGTALLAVMGAMKLLETRSRRDRYVVIGAGLFLLLAACLDRQQLLRVPLYGAHVWLCFAALAIVALDGHGPGSRAALGLAARTLAHALPLAVLLFLLFPRLSGSFWAVPEIGRAASGLGEELSPGSIAELTESAAVAFRVWFEERVPAPEERYWRGPVLHDFDGFTWRRARGALYRGTPLEYLGAPYRYRIALEPHARPWWFALDLASGSPSPRVLFAYDYQLLALQPVGEPVSYELTSYTRTRAAGELSRLARRRETLLPEGRNPRSRALAQRLHAQAGSDEAFSRAVLELFRTGGFEYTLTPPRTHFDFVDDFLFQTRRGFCGHFAAAYAALMRAGGVPARVVTGYLGGEWNPIGRYFIVRQSDAHAWAEVWLEGRGWTRVDPTGVVSPERLRRGILDILPGAVSAPARLVHGAPWLARAALAWDALDTWWKRRVLEFDLRAQLRVLERLGLVAPDARALAQVTALAALGWLAWLAWRLRRPLRSRRRDRLARAYLRLCARLAPIAPRAAHEGPLAYAERIAVRRPDLAPELRALALQYARLRFGAGASAAEVAAFARAVARLDPRPRSAPVAYSPRA